MQDFIQFVASQNPQQWINHKSWHSCAIGDFANSIGQLPPREEYSTFQRSSHPEVNVNPSSWSPQMNICIDTLHHMYIPDTGKMLSMYDVLSDGEINSEEHEDHDINTYGGLHDLIEWCIEEQ